MKVIIAGSRGINNKYQLTNAETLAGFKITEVVSGTARGVDLMGEAWADRHNIPVVRFPADWNKHGRSAGPIRNNAMADYADALLALWDGESRGTLSMIKSAKGRGLRVVVATFSGEELMPTITRYG